jgi:hypothetical protein
VLLLLPLLLLLLLLLLPLQLLLLLHNVDVTYSYKIYAPAVTKFNKNIIAVYTPNTSFCPCELSLCYTNLHIVNVRAQE